MKTGEPAAPRFVFCVLSPQKLPDALLGPPAVGAYDPGGLPEDGLAHICHQRAGGDAVPHRALRLAAVEAAEAGKKKKKGKEKQEGTTQAGSIQIPEGKPVEPVIPEENPTPIEPPVETEEVEVEVEEIEVEVDEDENKEG